MSLNRPTGHGSILDYIQIDLQFMRKRAQKVLLSEMTVTLSENQGQSHWHQTIQFSDIYHCTKFERNWSVNDRMQANVIVFLTASPKLDSLP